jgi:hypothetical protein
MDRLKAERTTAARARTEYPIPHPTVIAGHLRNLFTLLDTDPARGRELLSRFISPVVMTQKPKAPCGGVLLVGVTEIAGPNGRKVAGEVRPVDDVDGLQNWIEQAIRNYLTPSTFARAVLVVDTAVGPILAVNVEPSVHLVALWHADLKAGIEYLYRTDHGKQWMNPDEVERHLMNASRATRLAVQDVKAKVMLALHSDDGNPCIEIPYGVIRDTWVTTDGRPGLYLSVRLLRRHGGDITMEPLEQGHIVQD